MPQRVSTGVIERECWSRKSRSCLPMSRLNCRRARAACSFIHPTFHQACVSVSHNRINAVSRRNALSSRRSVTAVRRRRSGVRDVRMEANTHGRGLWPTAAELLASDIERAESLLQRCVFTVPSGAAAMARGRGVNMERLARAYGGVIAAHVRKTVGSNVDKEAFVESFMAGGKGKQRCGVRALVFESWMGMMDGKGRTGEMQGEDLGMLSRAYGWSVGRSVWLAGLEWDFEILGRAVGEWMESGGKRDVMDEEEYNRMFDIVADCAATVMGKQKFEDADGFFEMLRKEEDVEDLQGDGYVLGVRGRYRNDNERAREVGVGCVVKFGLRVRLLDGKALYVPRLDEGVRNDIEGRLEEMPPGLISVLTGMKEGESRTAFLHPYAAAEMLEIVMSFDEFSDQSQTGAVVDVFLKDAA